MVLLEMEWESGFIKNPDIVSIGIDV
jgi:hypothetical protein